MGLFNSKKEAKVACACDKEVPAYEADACGTDQNPDACCCVGDKGTNTCCGGRIEGICCVKVLGAGCKSCHEQYENARKAVEALEMELEVEYITDMEKVMEYGVMSMPAIVVNNKVVSMGKVLKSAEIIKLFEKLGF